MKAVSIATRGFISKAGETVEFALILLWPETATVRDNQVLEMTVVVNKTVDSPTVIDLSSDNPTSVSVPASVTIPADEFYQIFTATTLDPGSAQISATLGLVTLYSDIEVYGVTYHVKPPDPTSAKELKPKPQGALNLRPRPISGEEV
jgi:hypothetical protein